MRDIAQLDAAVERVRTLTHGVGIGGQRDWNVAVVDSTRIVLTPTEAADPARLTAALRALPNRPVPSQNADPLKLEGLPRIAEMVGGWLKPSEAVPLEVVTKG